MAVPRILAAPEPDDPGGSESRALELGLDLNLSLHPCPGWCVYRPDHADAVDTPLLRHRSAARLLEATHGGIRPDRPGRAVVSTQAEQFEDLSQPPMVLHAIEINGNEYAAYLTATEARQLAAHLEATANDIDPKTQ